LIVLLNIAEHRHLASPSTAAGIVDAVQTDPASDPPAAALGVLPQFHFAKGAVAPGI